MAMFLGLTHFQLSKSKGKHCAVVFFCGSASVVRPRPPPKTSERPVSLRPAVARSTTDRDRTPPPHMSPDDDSCSLIIGNDHLEGRKIKVAKSGVLKSGFRKSEVKKNKKGEILVGHFEPKGSTASSANMKIALGVCTAIGLVIFGVAR